jgi:serine/threonine protein kinase
MIDRVVSHYKILEKLGGGGMGVVYKAEDMKLDRIVALKFLPPELTRDDEAKKRFMQEAKTASSLDHNNICSIHEIDEADGQMFICMNYYEGETLKKKIDKGLMKIDETVDYALQIAKGLQKAHEKRIVHRDIKPANIFITSDQVVKILDFGLAKLTGYSVLTRVGETLGTTVYMSPEQSRGEKTDQRTDIWSLGVVLYEMVTGRMPFRGDYEQAVVYSIMNDEPEPVTGIRSNIPMELEKIIWKALRKKPSERYQHIDEMIVDLNSLKQEERHITEIHATPVKSPVKKKLIFTSAVLLLLLIVTGILYFSLTGTDTAGDRSNFIAVIPFTSFSGSDEDKEFAAGIHDDILTKLSKIKGLRVIARTSVLKYQDTKKSISEIASELNVGNILEGSTRRSGDVIRVTAQLINADTEEHMWAENYDRQYGDIFKIQTDVAQKIASALQIKLAPAEINDIKTALTGNMEAYEYFKKGEHFWITSFDFQGNLKAAQMFEKAVSIDSTFGEAWGWQSVAYMTAIYYAPNDSFLDKLISKAVICFKESGKIAPELLVTKRAKAEYYHLVQNDRERALKEFESLLEKYPNDTETLYRIAILSRGEKMLEYGKKVMELDPLGSQGPRAASSGAFQMGNYDEAERYADIMIANNPESGRSYRSKIVSVLHGKGEIDRAETIINEARRFAVRDLEEIIFLGISPLPLQKRL